uniref:Uncharacterized protein n=1 Tax=Anguilla anguilla TaxID=7936 RepID=A0A0E9SEG4_ANGAN
MLHAVPYSKVKTELQPLYLNNHEVNSHNNDITTLILPYFSLSSMPYICPP